MERGYIKLWRKTLDSGLLTNPDVFAFFVWALFKATHKPYKHLVGSQMVELQPGQFVMGRDAAAKELKSTPRKIRTAIDTLKKLSIISAKTTNKFTLITIVNWDTYQKRDPLPDQQATSKRPTNDHKQEHKEHKNKTNGAFGRFWEAYPKKVGKGAAEKSWQKLKPDLPTVLTALEWQRGCDQWQRGFIPNPATYLNQRRWEDEIDTAPTVGQMKNGLEGI